MTNGTKFCEKTLDVTKTPVLNWYIVEDNFVMCVGYNEFKASSNVDVTIRSESGQPLYLAA
jgi:hypothetical protein